MNVLHVLPYYAPAWAYGGVVRAVTDLTRAQAAAGHRVFVLTTDTLSPHARLQTLRETLEGVQVWRVRNRSNRLRGALNLSSPRGMAAAAEHLIREEGIAVVHCHELRTVENLLVTTVAQRLGVPTLVSPHGTLPYHTGRSLVKQLWDRVFGARLLPRFDGVVALTAHEAEDARRLWRACGQTLSDEAVFVVPNGVRLVDFADLPPAEPFRARWGLGTGPIALFLGRLHARKGVQLLIPAFADATRALPSARLLIVGPDEGMRATLETLARAHGVAERVRFTGLLTGADKLVALAAADVFALPAAGEGFSMAALEALACGLPVVLTPGCHFPEVAEAGAGLVVEREIGALSEALGALLSDRERRALMGRAARALVAERYTWERVVTQMTELYHRVKDKC